MANRNSKKDRDGVMKGMPQSQSFELQWGGIVLKDDEQICLSLDTAKKPSIKANWNIKEPALEVFQTVRELLALSLDGRG